MILSPNDYIAAVLSPPYIVQKATQKIKQLTWPVQCASPVVSPFILSWHACFTTSFAMYIQLDRYKHKYTCMQGVWVSEWVSLLLVWGTWYSKRAFMHRGLHASSNSTLGFTTSSSDIMTNLWSGNSNSKRFWTDSLVISLGLTGLSALQNGPNKESNEPDNSLIRLSTQHLRVY